MQPLVTCEYCERQYPEDSEGVGTICGGCYFDKFCFVCSWCENYGDTTDQHAYVAVFDPDEAGLPLAGFYRVRRLPYYAQGLIGDGWLYQDAIQWLGALPRGLEEPDGYPCGHFCDECQREMLKDIAERQHISHDVR